MKLTILLLLSLLSLLGGGTSFASITDDKTGVNENFSAVDGLYVETTPPTIEFIPFEYGIRIRLNGIKIDDVYDLTLDHQSIYEYTISEIHKGSVVLEENENSTSLFYDLGNVDFLGGKVTPVFGVVLQNGDSFYKHIIVPSLIQPKCGPASYFCVAAIQAVWRSGIGWVAQRLGWVAVGNLARVASWQYIKNHGFLPYRLAKKITAGHRGAIQAHHIVERRFALTLGQNVEEMYCLILTKADHTLVTQAWAKVLPRGVFRSPTEVRIAFRKVYKDFPEILKLEKYLF